MSNVSNRTALQVLGNTSGNLIAAGYIGERLFDASATRASPVAFTVGSPPQTKNIATVTLTTGVWFISGGVGSAQAGTTVYSSIDWAVSKTSGTLPATSTIGTPSAGEYWQRWVAPISPTNDINFTLGSFLYVATTSTPLYHVVSPTYTSTNPSWYGYLSAIRVG